MSKTLATLRCPHFLYDQIVGRQKDRFVAQITTKDGSLVDEIAFDRYSGYMGSVYE